MGFPQQDTRTARARVRSGMRAFGAAAVAALVSACADRAPVAPVPAGPLPASTAQQQAAQQPATQPATQPTLTWLAPLGTGTANSATFYAGASPVVEVCAWTGSACAAAPVARFATGVAAATNGSLPLVVNTAAGQFEASWDLMSASFSTRRTYRIRVLLGTTEVGAVSVDVVRGRWALTPATGTAPLLSEAALRIRFHLATPDAATIIPATTKVLDADAIERLGAVDLSSVTFTSGSAQVAQIAVGDVIVAGVTEQTPYGLLRRVVAKETSGSQVTFRTTIAAVTDAIERGTFHFSDVPLEPADVRPGMRQGMRNQVSAADVAAKFETALPDLKFGPYLKVEAKYEAELTLSGDLRIANGSLEMIAFTAGVTQKLEDEVTLSAGPSWTNRLLVKTWDVKPVTIMVGPVPIVLVPRVELWAKATAQAKAKLKASAALVKTSTEGFRYEGGTFTPISTSTDGVPTGKLLDASLEASLEFELGPRITVTPYLPKELLGGLQFEASVSMELLAYLKAEVAYVTDPWWELSGGLRANAAVDLRLWDWAILRKEGELSKVSTRLAKGGSKIVIVSNSGTTVEVDQRLYLNADVRSKESISLIDDLYLPISALRPITWVSRRPDIATVSPSPWGETVAVAGLEAGSTWVVGETTDTKDSVRVTVVGTARPPSVLLRIAETYVVAGNPETLTFTVLASATTPLTSVSGLPCTPLPVPSPGAVTPYVGSCSFQATFEPGTKTYRATVTAARASASGSATAAVVVRPAPAPRVELELSPAGMEGDPFPTYLPANYPVTLTFFVTAVAGSPLTEISGLPCTPRPALSGERVYRGSCSVATTLNVGTTTYHATATARGALDRGNGGKSVSGVKLPQSPAAPGAPTVSTTVSPLVVQAGRPETLTFATEVASTVNPLHGVYLNCYKSDGNPGTQLFEFPWPGTRPATTSFSGSCEDTHPDRAPGFHYGGATAITFPLPGQQSGPSESSSAFATVTPAPLPTVSLVVSPRTVQPGKPVTLTVTVTASAATRLQDIVLWYANGLERNPCVLPAIPSGATTYSGSCSFTRTFLQPGGPNNSRSFVDVRAHVRARHAGLQSGYSDVGITPAPP